MKYKIKDKVRVREDLIIGTQYGSNTFNSDMYPFKGEIVTIYDIVNDEYRIKEDSQNWFWTNEMFSGKVSKDFNFEELISQSTIPEEENSSDIITIKTTKVKLLLL